MQIISEGNKEIQKFFLPEGIKPSGAKRGSFMLCCGTADGMLACSTLTGELVLLSAEEEAALNGMLPEEESPALSELIKHRFVVREDCDEAKSADQLRTLLQRKCEIEKKYKHYNILPTTCCNARCFYCYESGLTHISMTEETAEALVQFITGHYDGDRVKLTWFGGEPTMARKRIDQICSRLEENSVLFESDMVSNAYLFDREYAKHAAAAWKLKHIQITLDGTEEVYNRAKAYVGVSDNPYQRALRNIQYLLDEEVSIDIRLNLDCYNAENLSVLADELSGRFTDRRFLKIYVGLLSPDVGYAPAQHHPGDEEHLLCELLRLREKLEERGWPQFSPAKLPALRINCCMADDPLAVQCTPEGILSKCEDQLYQNPVGRLGDGITDRKAALWWRQRTIYEGCDTCPLYPVCTRLLEHCPLKNSKCTDYDRQQRIDRYKDLMLRKYAEWKEQIPAGGQ